MVSLALNRFGKYSGDFKPKVINFYYISGIIIFISIFFIARVDGSVINLIYPWVHVVRGIMAILFVFLLIPNKSDNTTPFDRANNKLNFITLPLILIDMVLQDKIPFRIYPFIYLADVLIAYKLLLTSFTVNKSDISINQDSIKQFNLSNRELEVVSLIIIGKSNETIAKELFISVTTVKTHIRNIFKKTGISNRFELLSFLSNKP